MRDDDSWEQIRRARALNEDNVRGYGVLLEMEERLATALQGRGVPEAEAWKIEQGEGDLHLFALAQRVAAAGGHLEVRAVFDDEEVLLLREPEA